MNDDVRFKPVCRWLARSGQIAISNREQQHVDFALSSSKAVMSRPSFARFFGLKIHTEVRVETVICIDLRQRLKRLRAGNEWHRGQHDRQCYPRSSHCWFSTRRARSRCYGLIDLEMYVCPISASRIAGTRSDVRCNFVTKPEAPAANAAST